jgi:hypothetical protein
MHAGGGLSRIRAYVVPQSRLPTNSLSLKADMVVVYVRMRKWGYREKKVWVIWMMWVISYDYCFQKVFLLKRNHMSCQLT